MAWSAKQLSSLELPGFDCPVCMPRGLATTRTPEEIYLGTRLRSKVRNNCGDDHNSNDYDSNGEIQ